MYLRISYQVALALLLATTAHAWESGYANTGPITVAPGQSADLFVRIPTDAPTPDGARGVPIGSKVYGFKMDYRLLPPHGDHPRVNLWLLVDGVVKGICGGDEFRSTCGQMIPPNWGDETTFTFQSRLVIHMRVFNEGSGTVTAQSNGEVYYEKAAP